MKKSEIVDGFRKRVEKQNPWQPYRGPAGGQGWQNLITGEVRYQDSRPAPEEGVPEGHEGDIPTPEEEPPDELPSWEPDPVEAFSEGDEVKLDLMDVSMEEVEYEDVDAEITYLDEDTEYGPKVQYEHPESGIQEEHQVSWEEIATDPREMEAVEPPPDGWADGWTDAPDDHEELESGQIVEVYDLHEDEYKEGEIRQIEEWDEGLYVDISTEDGDVYEFMDGEPTGSGEGSVLTAVEDILDPEVMEDWDPMDFEEEYLNNEEVAFWNDIDNEVVTGVIEEQEGDSIRIRDEEDDMTWWAEPDGSLQPLTEQGEMEVEFADVETIDTPELMPEDPSDMTLHDGALAEVDLPGVGETIGEIQIVDHGPDQGRWMYVGDEDVGIPLDQPDHPLAQQVEFGEIESQWIDVEGSEETGFNEEVDDLMAEVGLGEGEAPVDLGDKILYGDRTFTVTGVDPQTGEVELNGGETTWSANEAASFVDYRKPANMPDEPTEAPWDEALPHEFKQEDTIAFYDADEGEIRVGEVEEDYGDGDVEVTNYGTVSEDEVVAWADTGLPAPNQVEPHDVAEGSVVTVQAMDGHQFEGYVTETSTYGVPSMTVMDENGETVHVELNERDYGLVDHDPYGDAGDVIDTVGDWEDRDTEELANEFYEEVVSAHQHNNYLAKYIDIGDTISVIDFFKHEQEKIKTRFMQHFPPDEVEGFYSAISNWKGSSGIDGQNRKLEEAFRRAMDSHSRVRGEHEDRPDGPMPPRAWTKMAEVANEMSRYYWEDFVGPNVGYQLTRDCADTSLKSFMLEWADNPDADEYGFDGRTLNNFQLSPGTWNDWRVTPSDVSAEDIGLMTDMMFNPMETNAQEDEIWVNPDTLTVQPDQVGVGPDRTDLSTDGHFGGDVSEWTDNQVRTVSREIAQYYDDLTIDESEVYRPDELSDQQIETFLQVAERAEELGVTEDHYSVDNFASLVEAEAVERGITTPSTVEEHPILETAADLPEGTEVTMREHTGETFPGDVVGAEGDQVVVENVDTGRQAAFDYDAIDEIVWAPERYGKPAGVDLSDFDIEEFDPLDDVYVWSGGDWVEGSVLEAEDGTVEVSLDTEYGGTDFFDEDMIREENYVVPQEMVEADEPEGPDGDGLTEDFEVDELEVGDDVEVGYTTVGYEDPVEVLDYDDLDEEVQVQPNDGGEPQWIPASQVEGIVADGSDAFGAITDAFESPHEVASGDSVEFLHPETGEVESANVSGVFGESEVLHIDGVEDPVPLDHARPAEGTDDPISHEDIDTGTQVRVEHFDPGIGETSGTIIGYDEDKQAYIADISPEGQDPAADQMFYVETQQVLDIEGESEVNESAVEQVSDVSDSFTQQTPGSADEATEEPTVTSEDLSEGDYIVWESFGTEVEAEVVDPHLPDDAVQVENEDGETMTIYESEIVEGPDSGVTDPANLEPGDQVDIAGDGTYLEVVDVDPETEQITVETEGGSETSVSFGMVEGVDTADDTGGVDWEPGAEVESTDLSEGDQVLVQITEDNLEPAEVFDTHEGTAALDFVDDPDSDLFEYEPDSALTVYEAEEDAEGSDDAPDLSELPDLETGETAYVDTEGYDHYPAYEGEAEVVAELSDGYVLETPEGEEVMVGPGEVESEGPDDADDFMSIPPEAIHDAEPGIGDQFETTIPGEGETEVIVSDTSVDPAYPVEVEAEDGLTYLIWDDGEVEPV